jgi:formylglycine-generating enzyme required for sulfatase activity
MKNITPASRALPAKHSALAVVSRWLVLALATGFTFAAQAQRTATAVAALMDVDGGVLAYTVTDGGEGYMEPPVVAVWDAGGSGTGAVAVAEVTGGVVTQINTVSSGRGYLSPQVWIAGPAEVPRSLNLQTIALVTLRGLPGDSNQIETATSPDASVWVPLTTVVLTNGVQEWYDRVSPPGAYRFYRYVLLGAGTRPTPGPRFVWLPAGSFTMGSPATEADRGADEGPQTQVTLSRGFYLGRYEVTQGEYLSVIGSNPSGFTGDTNRPVEKVSWNDATNYCARLTEREQTAGRLPAGWVYRLPTEAEWEYASRAGSTNRFSYGEDTDYTQTGNYAWCSANSMNASHAVGGKLPSIWGLYDISGNVWEWCSDWYGVYPGGNVIDPQGEVSGSGRVLRGGAWYYDAASCRSANRNYGTTTSKDNRVGFRVVLAPG